MYISTHAPLAGRDKMFGYTGGTFTDFNPRAPCGARHEIGDCLFANIVHFNPRAPCGARRAGNFKERYPASFQPTRPLRGATMSA